MTTIDYRKKYECALELAMQLKESNPTDNNIQKFCQNAFSELKDDEDEITRKEILSFVKCVKERGIKINVGNWVECDCNKWILWLEKQKPTYWSEKDIKMIDDIIDEVRPLGECPDYLTDRDREYYYKGQDMVDWLERLKKYGKVQVRNR